MFCERSIRCGNGSISFLHSIDSARKACLLIMNCPNLFLYTAPFPQYIQPWWTVANYLSQYQSFPLTAIEDYRIIQSIIIVIANNLTNVTTKHDYLSLDIWIKYLPISFDLFRFSRDLLYARISITEGSSFSGRSLRGLTRSIFWNNSKPQFDWIIQLIEYYSFQLIDI